MRLVVAVLTVLAAVRPPMGQTEETASSARRPGPPLEVHTLEGRALKLQRLKGKVVLVDFMTTTCPTCKAASSGLQQLYGELGPKGFFPVAVALNISSLEELKEYAREHQFRFAVGTTSRKDVAGYLNHPSDKRLHVPTLVLLDRKGRIFSIEAGWKGTDSLRASVLHLLDESR